jgi:two-component system CheB/CheR fusion protein
LDNAAKFSDRGARITVTLEADESQLRARLTVADTGIGIDPAMMPRLFEPFSQGDSSPARKNDGLGLGLALVRALVQMHGGSVQVSSEGIGQGARFIVELPMIGAPEVAAG